MLRSPSGHTTCGPTSGARSWRSCREDGIAAEAYVDSAMVHNSTFPGHHFHAQLPYHRARAKVVQNRIDEALVDYELTLFRQPVHTIARREMAELLDAQGREEEALQHYRVCLEQWDKADPGDPVVAMIRNRVARLEMR